MGGAGACRTGAQGSVGRSVGVPGRASRRAVQAGERTCARSGYTRWSGLYAGTSNDRSSPVATPAPRAGFAPGSDKTSNRRCSRASRAVRAGWAPPGGCGEASDAPHARSNADSCALLAIDCTSGSDPSSSPPAAADAAAAAAAAAAAVVIAAAAAVKPLNPCLACAVEATTWSRQYPGRAKAG